MTDNRQQAINFRFGLVALLIVLPLLLVKFDIPPPPPPRFWRHLFNFGHVPLFVLIGYLTWRGFLKHTDDTFAALIGSLVLSLLIGITIELVQSLIGRTASWNDLQLDSIGLLLFVVAGPAQLPMNKTSRRLSGIVLIICLTLKLVPLAAASIDYYTLERQPALLSDFESIGQRSRWTRGTLTTVNDQNYNQSLRVSLGTELYEGSTLEYLPRNWKDYSALQLDIFCADQNPALLHIKIRDSQAMIDGDHYEMQFNHVEPISPGWNRIKLSLDQIRNGPRDRSMNLDKIHALTLFFVDRKTPGYMLVDNLRLQ